MELEEKDRTLIEKERELVLLRGSLFKTDEDLKAKSSEVKTLTEEKAAIQSKLDDAARALDDERRKLREADDRVRMAEDERNRVQDACTTAEAARKDLTARLMKAEEEVRVARAQAEGIMQEAVDRAVEEYKASQAFAEEFEDAASRYFLKGAKRMMDELVDKCGFKSQWADIPIIAHIRGMPASSPEMDLSSADGDSAGPATSKGKATQGKGKGSLKTGGPSKPGTGFSSDEDLPMYEVPPTPMIEEEDNALPPADDQVPPPPETPAVQQHPSDRACLRTCPPVPAEDHPPLPAEDQLQVPAEGQPPLPAEDHLPPPAEDQPPPPAED